MREQSALLPELCRDADTVSIKPSTSSSPNGASVIKVSPPSLDVARLEPDTSYRYCVYIFNQSGGPRTYLLSSVDLVGSSDPKQQVDIIDPPTAAGTWVQPAVPSVTVPARSDAIVPFVLRTPSSIPDGTSVAGLRIANPPLDDDQTGFNASVLTYIYVTAGDAKPSTPEVRDVSAPRLMINGRDDVTYRARFNVSNPGRTIIEYDASLSVGAFGRTVHKSSRGRSPLLPGGSHDVVLEWKDVPWIGIYRPTAVLKHEGRSTEVRLPWLFILPPVPYVIAILAAILVPLAYVFYRWRRRRKEWMAYLMEEIEREERGESLEEDVDDYWDPMRQP